MQNLWNTSYETSNTSIATSSTGRPHTLGASKMAQSLGIAAAAIVSLRKPAVAVLPHKQSMMPAGPTLRERQAGLVGCEWLHPFITYSMQAL